MFTPIGAHFYLSVSNKWTAEWNLRSVQIISVKLGVRLQYVLQRFNVPRRPATFSYVTHQPTVVTKYPTTGWELLSSGALHHGYCPSHVSTYTSNTNNRGVDAKSEANSLEEAERIDRTTFFTWSKNHAEMGTTTSAACMKVLLWSTRNRQNMPKSLASNPGQIVASHSIKYYVGSVDQIHATRKLLNRVFKTCWYYLEICYDLEICWYDLEICWYGLMNSWRKQAYDAVVSAIISEEHVLIWRNPRYLKNNTISLCWYGLTMEADDGNMWYDLITDTWRPVVVVWPIMHIFWYVLVRHICWHGLMNNSWRRQTYDFVV
jgi:hypothetical protein